LGSGDFSLNDKILKKEEMDTIILNLSEIYDVFGPIKRKFDYSFKKLEGEKPNLHYPTTTISPKKFFHHKDTLISYQLGGDFIPHELELEKPLLILGVHPCDLNAILKLDQFFSKDYQDPFYLERRKNSVIIALNCIETRDNCFCLSTSTGPSAEEGFDLLLTDLGNRYLLEVGSPKGEEIMARYDLKDADLYDIEEKENRIEKVKASFKKKITVDGLAEHALKNTDHEVWNLIGEKGGLAGCFSCLSCGSCSLVCPTCYCFDVYESLSLSLKKGSKIRELDSCQLLGYAEVALGGNFRKDRTDRIRHWMLCKFGAASGGLLSNCVGCGRCVDACPVHIDITEVAKTLWGD